MDTSHGSYSAEKIVKMKVSNLVLISLSLLFFFSFRFWPLILSNIFHQNLTKMCRLVCIPNSLSTCGKKCAKNANHSLMLLYNQLGGW